jgi:glycerophosphoryl diester phosphodiesterase
VIRRVVALVAVGVLLAGVDWSALGGSGATSGPSIPTMRGPLIAAHRGGAGLWPENSLTAFKGALALGVDALEFDVHQTADGEVVVIHDAMLDRTTTGVGALRDATRATLATTRLRGRDGAATDEHVPTLAQVLDLAARARVEVLPELKTDETGAPYEGLEARVLAALAARGLSHRAVVQSFDAPTLARVRAQAPAARTMLLASRTRLGAGGISVLDLLRRAADLGATDVGLDRRIVEPSVVAAARAAKLRLAVWTVNDEAELRRMAQLGVDVVMTDRPDVARRVFGRH